MSDQPRRNNPVRKSLPKSPTGIRGLDDVLDGGLPSRRPTLVCGAAGCGKTLFSMQFLVRGALLYDEPGAFIAFEERPEDLAANAGARSRVRNGYGQP